MVTTGLFYNDFALVIFAPALCISTAQAKTKSNNKRRAHQLDDFKPPSLLFSLKQLIILVVWAWLWRVTLGCWCQKEAGILTLRFLVEFDLVRVMLFGAA